LFSLDAFFRETLFSVIKKKVWTSQPAHRPKDFKFSQFGYQSGKTKNGIISSRLSRDNADEKL
tara:strand:- start:1219 stop:1407 length:189 start_codon:yes stop_codon:yes gene_type:complete